MHRKRFVLLLLFLLSVGGVVACAGDDPDAEPTPPPTAVSPEATSSPSTIATGAPPPPLLPTAPAVTPLPPPSSHDPSLPAWTVLIYFNADYPLAPAPPDDLAPLQTLEATLATFTTTAQIPLLQTIVQVDRRAGLWSETRRYALSGDTDPATLGGEPVQSLGEVDMADGATLAEFLAWGRENYPANRYALILLGPGAGWQSLGFDDDGGARPGTTLTLNEAATAVSPQPPLDLIALHTPYAAQLDVLRALGGGARYVVAPPQHPPPPGPVYATLLALLMETPQLEGGALARQLAAAAPAPLLAADLSALPPLNHAVAQLAAVLNHNPALSAGAVGDAANAAALGFAAPGAAPMVDLAPFAAALAQRSPDPLTARTAVSLTTVLEPVRLTPAALALAFPTPGDLPAYGNASRLPGWSQFLSAYTENGLDDRPRAGGHLPYLLRETVSGQNPAYYNFEIAGADLARIVRLGGSAEEEEQRLLWWDPIAPERPLTGLPNTAVPLFVQGDGVVSGHTIWDGQSHYLSAGESGGFVVAWPPGRLGENSPLLVPGRLERAGASYPAEVVFEKDGAWRGMWAALPEGSLTAVIPQAGDAFQVAEYYLTPAGDLTQRWGGTLPLDENVSVPLSLDRRPVLDGSYFLGVAAANTAGALSSALVPVTVAENNIEIETSTYLDPRHGFQFRYPVTWLPPRYEGARLVTGNVSGTIRLQLTVYPDLNPSQGADDLADETLAQFGGVDTLFTEAVTVDGASGRRLAYGYEDVDGTRRTGLFVAVVREGAGFVVDVDGPAAQEADTITVLDTILADWEFTGVGTAGGDRHWKTTELPSLTVPQPITFTYGRRNAWRRFNSGQSTFIAFRLRPSDRSAAQALADEVAVAGAGVSDFQAGEGDQIGLNGRSWRRASFTYRSGGESIAGMIIVHVADEREIVVWAEAPQAQFAALAESVFLVMVAGLTMR